MSYKIIDAKSGLKVPSWGNKRQNIAVHYLGVDGQNHDIDSDGCGAHYYIYWDGTIYQRCSHDAIVWQVGTAGYYTQKHPTARNSNTIGIEMCCHCDGDKSSAEDKKWYFTKETQNACVWLVQKLMKDENISIDHVLRHYDIVNKTCPAPYVHNNKYKTSWTWDEFKAKVAGKTTETVASGTQSSDLAKLSDKDAAIKILQITKPIAEKYGLKPEVVAGQSILKSGYGHTTVLSKSNNVLGMKCDLVNSAWSGSSWDGKSKVLIHTPEQDANGKTYYIDAYFRAYKCIEDCIADICAFFTSYAKYNGVKNCKTYAEQIKFIRSHGYATDVSYDKKVIAIIEKYGLDKYGSGSTTTTGGDYMFNVGDVKSGSTGNDVKLLQRLLKSNGCKGTDNKNLTIDGNAGTNTVAAIKKYQKKNKLTADGWCGSATWKSILYR